MSKRKVSPTNMMNPPHEKPLVGDSEKPPRARSKSPTPPPPPPPPQTSDWKRSLRIAVFLSLFSTVFTVYQRISDSHASSSSGRAVPNATPARLPESYALCGGEGGKVYTVDEKNPNVDCVLVVRDRVLDTGSKHEISIAWDAYQNETIKKFYGNEPKAKKPLVVYTTPPGSIVVPGLTDAHAHLIEYGFKVQLPLDTAQSLDEVLDILEAFIESHSEVKADPTKWIRGMGWDQTRWKGQNDQFPTAKDLSSRPLLASRPIALSRVDGHALWVSPRAIELAKEQLPHRRWPEDGKIEGGEIVRDGNGNPSGVFVDTAMDLIPVPTNSPEEMEQFALRAFEDALSVGLTSVHDASSMASETIEIFKKLADEDKLSIRVYAMASPDTPAEDQLEDYGPSKRLSMKSVKIFTDGALGSWGAALLDPYSDNPTTSGLMRTSESKLAEIVKRVWDDGWGVNIHCIGDRANKAVLDIYERLLNGKGSSNEEKILKVARDRRPRIEHAQIMRVEDLKRTGRLGVIASVQPTHATSDMWYAESRLGPERIKGAYAYQTLLQSSPVKVLPLGSDFPVEGINPLLGFYAAVTRLDVRGQSPHGDQGWYTSERLTRSQALKGMTLDAAYASFSEEELGSIVKGKKADFVVLSQDLMDENVVSGDKILETKVLATVVDGRLAFGKV